MLIEKYYEGNIAELERRAEMEKLIKDYSFKNKKTLREIVKLTWTDSI